MGTSATVSAGATLELAGSVSALGTAPGNLTSVTNNSQADAGGILVSGSNQQTGPISGSGSLVVGSAGQISASEVLQSSTTVNRGGQLTLAPNAVPATSTFGALSGPAPSNSTQIRS